MKYRTINKSFVYKKALAQQEKGGVTWRVITGLIKRPDGTVEAKVYEPRIPSKYRAKALAKILNQCP